MLSFGGATINTPTLNNLTADGKRKQSPRNHNFRQFTRRRTTTTVMTTQLPISHCQRLIICVYLLKQIVKYVVSGIIDINPALCTPGLTHFLGVDNDQDSAERAKFQKTSRIGAILDSESNTLDSNQFLAPPAYILRTNPGSNRGHKAISAKVERNYLCSQSLALKTITFGYQPIGRLPKVSIRLAMKSMDFIPAPPGSAYDKVETSRSSRTNFEPNGIT